MRSPVVVISGLVAVAALTACSDSGPSAGASMPSSETTGSSPTTSPTSGTDHSQTASSTPPPSTGFRTDLVTPAPSVKPTGQPSLPPGANPIDPTAGPIDPALDPYVALAKADLAARLKAPEDAIEVAVAMTVTWPDTSLGCPQPGMEYLQTLVDGAMIVLMFDGKNYGYRAGGDKKPFLCEQ